MHLLLIFFTVDICVPNPCENDGTCSEGYEPSSFMCNCKPGYTGEKCEESIGKILLDFYLLISVRSSGVYR